MRCHVESFDPLSDDAALDLLPHLPIRVGCRHVELARLLHIGPLPSVGVQLHPLVERILALLAPAARLHSERLGDVCHGISQSDGFPQKRDGDIPGSRLFRLLLLLLRKDYLHDLNSTPKESLLFIRLRRERGSPSSSAPFIVFRIQLLPLFGIDESDHIARFLRH